MGRTYILQAETGNGSQVHPHTNKTLPTHHTKKKRKLTVALQQDTHNRVIENRNKKKRIKKKKIKKL